MSIPTRPRSILSSGFIKMKVKALSNKGERKKACEAYLLQMVDQREVQKRSRGQVDDTDVCIRWLKMELEQLGA